MSVAEPKVLSRHMSDGEQLEFIDKAIAAFKQGDQDKGYAYLAQIPLIPSLAEFVVETKGIEYCEGRFNLANLSNVSGKK